MVEAGILGLVRRKKLEGEGLCSLLGMLTEKTESPSRFPATALGMRQGYGDG